MLFSHSLFQVKNKSTPFDNPAVTGDNSLNEVTMEACGMHFIHHIRHHFFTREFLLFLVVGGVNTFNGTFLSWLYAFLIPNHNVAFNCGYLTSNLIAYYLNSTFIFPEPLSLKRCLKFALSYVPNYIIQNLIVLLFYNFLGYPPILSYLIAAVLGIPVTFLFVKIFAFGRR